MTITLKPLDKPDAPALTTLFAAVEEVDATGEHLNEADFVEEFDNPDMEVGKDYIGAYDGDQLVGCYSVLVRRSEGDRKAYGFGATHPERRGEGIGGLLVEGMMTRLQELRQAAGEPLRVLVEGTVDNTAQAELLAGAGLVADRWSFVMSTSLDQELPAVPELPEGYAIRGYQDGDGERWLETHNRAFADHPNFSLWVPSEWDFWVVGSRAFRPELSFFVTPDGSPDEIAAYLQTNEYDAYFEATGKREAYVAKVGTVPEHRGRGLASLLLRHCLAAYREAGFDVSGLDVDSQNPTGALGIYERAGFQVEHRKVTYAALLT